MLQPRLRISLHIKVLFAGESDGTFDFANYSVEAGDIRSAVQYIQTLGLNVVGLVGVAVFEFCSLFCAAVVCYATETAFSHRHVLHQHYTSLQCRPQ